MMKTRPETLIANLMMTILGAACAMAMPLVALAAEPSPLQLEAKIPLGNVKGRIDHMAVDLARQRLFVAELGNDSLGVIDLKARKVAKRISGLKEPQGVGYVAATDTVYVANAADGSVRLFRGEALDPAGVIDLKSDADNIRVDAERKQVLVGYGGGAIAVIDATNNTKIADIPLRGHPESFQLSDTGQIFVNLPSVRAVGVVDRASGRETATWPTRNLGGNYPMTLNDAGKHLIVAFRDRSEKEIRDIYVSRLENGKWTDGTPLHNDNWEIDACPVNGPMLSARGRQAVVAWFTVKNDQGQAWAAFSGDAGHTWGARSRC